MWPKRISHGKARAMTGVSNQCHETIVLAGVPTFRRLGGAAFVHVRRGFHVTISATTRRTLRYSLAATLLLSCAPAALHAESSDKDEKIRKLESMMTEMQSQIRSLKAAVGEERVEGRRTREKVRIVEKGGYALPPPTPAFPAPAARCRPS